VRDFAAAGRLQESGVFLVGCGQGTGRRACGEELQVALVRAWPQPEELGLCWPARLRAEAGCAGPRCNQLSPDVKRAAFSAEEDAIIFKV